MSFLVVVLVAAIVLLQHTLPDEDRRYRPIATKGHIGEVIRTSDFRVAVHKVDVARSITEAKDALSEAEPMPARGIWVIVWARAATEREPSSLDWPEGVQLVTRTGNHYAAKAVGGLDRTSLEPDLWKYGPLVFEIPPDRLAGAELLLSTESRPALNSQAHVFLDLDAAEAERLIGNAPKTYALEAVRYT